MQPLDLTNLREPLVVMPMDHWSRITEKGLRFALVLSKEVQVVHVDCDDDPDHPDSMCNMWEENVAQTTYIATLSQQMF